MRLQALVADPRAQVLAAIIAALALLMAARGITITIRDVIINVPK